MGDSEYGGNGSVHHKGTNRKDRKHGPNKKTDSIDDLPASGGDFITTIFDVNPNAFIYDPIARTLTARVRIKHGAVYTRQILTTWPPDLHPTGIAVPDAATAESTGDDAMTS